MIVLDRQDNQRERHYIGIQRPDGSYTYLHWQTNDVIKMGKYYFTKYPELLEDCKDMYAIGSNPLVVWS